jgi:hypothetical protein
MDDEERLRQRIFLAIDALPVPPAPRQSFPRKAPAIGFGGVSFSQIALASAVTAVVLLVVASVVSTSGRPASPQAKPGTFSDDFAVGISPARWTVTGTGTGHTVVAVKGAVELTLDADAKPSSEGYYSASLMLLACVARGDYEVSIDYELLNWPAANGTEVGLREYFPGSATISRDEFGERDIYQAHGTSNVVTNETTDARGSLRLVRRGTRVVASHRSSESAAWIELPIQIESQFDETFAIYLAASETGFGGKKARAAFNNFHLTAAQLICR